MKNNYLNKLEFDQVLQKLTEYCHTYIGKEKALDLEPSADKNYVKKELKINTDNFGFSFSHHKNKSSNFKHSSS